MKEIAVTEQLVAESMTFITQLAHSDSIPHEN